MRLLKLTGVLIGIFIILGFFLIWYIDKSEDIESYYPDYNSALNAKAVGTGKWIPEFLPLSATEIHEKHNLDINNEWLFFRFKGDVSSIGLSCTQIPYSKVVYPYRPGNWWPKGLIKDANKNQQNANYKFYLCNDNGFMALDIQKNEGYYWLN